MAILVNTFSLPSWLGGIFYAHKVFGVQAGARKDEQAGKKEWWKDK